MTDIRMRAVRGLKTGDRFLVTRTFSEEDMVAFARVSRDFNPVHFDDRFAAAKGFRNRICHGLLPASMITMIGGQIGWLATGMDFKFKKPVYFGDTITCEFTILRVEDHGKARGEAVFKNQDDTVVVEAVVTGFVPGREERKILMGMLEEGDPTNLVDSE